MVGSQSEPRKFCKVVKEEFDKVEKQFGRIDILVE